MNCPKCGRPINALTCYCKHCDQVFLAASEQASGQAPEPPVPRKHGVPESTVPRRMQETAEPVISKPQVVKGPVVLEQSPAPYPQKKRRKKRSRILWIFIPVLLILAIFLFRFFTAEQKIHLNDYLIIELEGYDNFGQAKAVIDWERLYEENDIEESFTLEKLGDLSSFGFKEIKGLVKGVIPELKKENQLNVLKEMVHFHIEPQNSLSNGDVINYYFEVDPKFEDIIKDMDILLTHEEGSLTVTELADLEHFDAFADIEVYFKGVSPFGVVVFEDKSENNRGLIYKVDSSSNTKNGDRVILKILPESVEYAAKNFGEIPAEMEKAYTVSGLLSIVEQSSDLDEQTLTDLQKKAQDLFISDWMRNQQGKKLEAFTYLGNYILKAKTGDQSFYNKLVLVYRVKVQLGAQSDEKNYNKFLTYYWAAAYPDVLKDSQGLVSINDLESVEINNNFTVNIDLQGSSKHDWNFCGFDTYSELYRGVVMRHLDNFFVSEDIKRDLEDTKLPNELEVLNDEQERKDKGQDRSDNSEHADHKVSVKDEYILPDSSKRILKMSDLRGLSLWEAMVARNEIFARHGRRFKMKELQEHFDNCSWYSGTISPDHFNPNLLSKIEQENVALIEKYEIRMGYR